MVQDGDLAGSFIGRMSTVLADLWLADIIVSYFEGGGASNLVQSVEPFDQFPVDSR
jgi:hypothetical protein